MSFRLKIRSAAEMEIVEAALWYDRRTAGLGHAFIESVDACIAGLLRQPTIYRKCHREYRKIITRRFPYAIFYLVEGDLVSVVAVKHLAQSPDQIRRDLR